MRKGSSTVEQRTHNALEAGSIPAPCTKRTARRKRPRPPRECRTRWFGRAAASRVKRRDCRLHPAWSAMRGRQPKASSERRVPAARKSGLHGMMAAANANVAFAHARPFGGGRFFCARNRHAVTRCNTHAQKKRETLVLEISVSPVHPGASDRNRTRNPLITNFSQAHIRPGQRAAQLGFY